MGDRMRRFRIALAQINPTVGDLEGNSDLIIDTIKRARELDFDLLAKDVEPFIFSKKDGKKVRMFPEFVESAIRTSPY